MSEQNTNSNKLKAIPKDLKSNKLKAAFAALAPMIEKAKEEISKLPLRPVVDPISSEEIMLRFATAEELQRIIMMTCLGRLIINTVPVKLGSEPAVVSQVAVLTDDGYVVLPGSHASQKLGEGAVELGHKQLLSAETRSIRRSLRDLGLRAEYEEYDAQETNRLKEVDGDSKVKAKDDSEDSEKNTEKELVEDNSENDDDSEIPTVPKGYLGSSKKTGKPTDSKATEVADKPKNQKTKTKTKAKVASKPAAKQNVQYSIPDKALDIEVDREHADWPSINSIRYQNELLDALGKVRTKSGMTVGVMAQRVFGKEHEPSKRLATYTTKELELFYQYYVILNEKH